MRAGRSFAFILVFFSLLEAGEEALWVKDEGGAGKGRHDELVAGDEDYHTEESVPLVAKIWKERNLRPVKPHRLERKSWTGHIS